MGQFFLTRFLDLFRMVCFSFWTVRMEAFPFKVCWWDTRKGGAPEAVISLQSSHIEPVYKVPLLSICLFFSLSLMRYLTKLTSPDDVDLKQDQQWVLHSLNRWHRHVVGHKASGQNIKINSFFSDKIALKTKDNRSCIMKRHKFRQLRCNKCAGNSQLPLRPW